MKHQEFRDEGWRSVDEWQFPPSDTVVEFSRDETVYRQEPWFGKWSDMRPEFNVAGLWWRPR